MSDKKARYVMKILMMIGGVAAAVTVAALVAAHATKVCRTATVFLNHY